LAEQIASDLNLPLEDCVIGQFADGEINIQIKNNVRGSDVFIIQPTSPDVNKNLMELLLLIHTLKLSSAKRITAVVPYFGYARQDRKTKPRVPISASAVSQLIEAMNPDRVVTVDLHCGQIQGFFHSTPVHNLFAENVFVTHLKKLNFDTEKLVIVSPDAGGVARARRYADKLNAAQVVTILKRRTVANQVDSMQIVGDVDGYTCLIADDMIDTAGTLCKAADLLTKNGASRVLACATHGLLTGPAVERITNSSLEHVYVTDSIPQQEKVNEKITVCSLVPLLSSTIDRLHNEKSLSVLFNSLHTFEQDTNSDNEESNNNN